MNRFTIKKNQINIDLIQIKGKYFVYHLIKDNKVLYIGYSKNIYKRLKEHKYQKDFDTIVLIPVGSLIEARVLERADIFTIKPELNIFCMDKFMFPSDKVPIHLSDLLEASKILNR